MYSGFASIISIVWFALTSILLLVNSFVHWKLGFGHILYHGTKFTSKLYIQTSVHGVYSSGNLYHEPHLNFHSNVWVQDEGGFGLNSQNSLQLSPHSQSSPYSFSTTPSPQYFWYALHILPDPFWLLHFHSMWWSLQTILGCHVLNPAAHISLFAFQSHGWVCIVEKYVVDPPFDPQFNSLIVLHCFEHEEFFVPLFGQSSHSSHSVFWSTQSPHRSWSATHCFDDFQWLSHCHVYTGWDALCLLKPVTVQASHNQSLFSVNQDWLISKYLVSILFSLLYFEPHLPWLYIGWQLWLHPSHHQILFPVFAA